MSLEIKTVKTKAEKKQFVKSQWNFYEDDPNFAPPVVADRMKLLNTEKNPFYEHSEIELFTAHRDGKIVGRIAGITNELHNEIHADKLGFFGFFECENNQETADALYKAAEDWVKSKGKNAIRGPVNPSMNDENAFLIEGFDSPAILLMPYNPKYYLDITEKAGYHKAKDLYAYQLHYEDFMTEKLDRLQTIIRDRYKITTRYVDFKNKEQFRKDVNTLKEIYNAAWEPNWGFVKMTDNEFDFLTEDFKQFAIDNLAVIVEQAGKPVGFALGLPNLNEVLIHNKGGGLIGAGWHLLTKKHKVKWMRIIVLGVLPEYHSKGVDAVLYYEMGRGCKKNNMLGAEASWILEDNQMMNRALTQTMNGKLYKKYRIYEKEL